MLTFNVTLPTKAVSASAELGRAVVGASSDFRLTSSLDANKTIRSHPTVGTISTAHSKTKELGGEAGRHLFRVDLAQNGDLAAATAQLVMTHVPTQAGRLRALEALNLLISGLIRFGMPDLDDPDVSITQNAVAGFPPMEVQTENPYNITPFVENFVARLTNDEG
jgi:hypothetical protein